MPATIEKMAGRRHGQRPPAPTPAEFNRWIGVQNRIAGRPLFKAAGIQPE